MWLSAVAAEEEAFMAAAVVLVDIVHRLAVSHLAVVHQQNHKF